MSEQRGLSRRGFVGATAGATAAALGAPPALGQDDRGRGGRGRLLPRHKIGIQLFTIRDQVATLGFEEVFRRLSEIGYREVEFAGYSAQGRRWSNEELRRLLRRYGLRGVGSHIGYTTFLSDLEQVLDDAEEIGLPYVGTANSPGAVHGRGLSAGRGGLQPLRRRRAGARDPLLPAQPLRRVRAGGRDAAL
jgi:hypothetical protein